MSINKSGVLSLLKEKKISYTLIEHKPVNTYEEILDLDMPNSNFIAKNLFIRDDKKQNYYLLVTREENRVNLKELESKISSIRLSFASENDLEKILNLPKGSVTPFGILNDDKRRVKIFIDSFFSAELLGIHPNENTATLWMNTQDLVDILKEHGNEVEFVKL